RGRTQSACTAANVLNRIELNRAGSNGGYTRIGIRAIENQCATSATNFSDSSSTRDYACEIGSLRDRVRPLRAKSPIVHNRAARAKRTGGRKPNEQRSAGVYGCSSGV